MKRLSILYASCDTLSYKLDEISFSSTTYSKPKNESCNRKSLSPNSSLVAGIAEL
jgi:hypothetical protein